MFTRSYKNLSVWLTLAMLFGAAIPSGAQEAQIGGRPELDPAGEVRLNLEGSLRFAMTIEGADPRFWGSAAADGFAPQPAPLPDLSQATAPAAWSSLQRPLGGTEGGNLQQQTAAAEAQAAPKKRSFGRWLKKHWYVPVLVAGAIGAAAASSGDDDSSGEDD